MIISVGCPTCGHRYDIPGKLAGKKVRCKECTNNFRVPVPETMTQTEPRKRKKRKPTLDDAEFANILDDATASTTGPASLPVSDPLVPDLGERRSYRAFQVISIALFSALWWFGFASPLRMAIAICLLLGAFCLLPVVAGWGSFDQTRRAKILGRVLGKDGAKAMQATIGIAFWVVAVLIGFDAIHLAVLTPPPEPPASATNAPSKPAEKADTEP